MIEEVISLTIDTIQNKEDYFNFFKNVVDYKNKNNTTKTGNPQQWENEKWLQTELVREFWKNDIKRIPEYNSIDIFIKDNIYIELKERCAAGINAGYLGELTKTILDFRETNISYGCLLFVSTFYCESPNNGERIKFIKNCNEKDFELDKCEKYYYSESGGYEFTISEDFSLKFKKEISENYKTYCIKGSLKRSNDEQDYDKLFKFNRHSELRIIKINNDLFIHIWIIPIRKRLDASVCFGHQ